MQNFDLNFSLEEVNFIIAGVQELPARIANPLTEKIRTQAEKQLTLEIKEMPEESAE